MRSSKLPETISMPCYSIFCTCSHICSINTFSSTEIFETSTSDLEPSVLASRFQLLHQKSRRLPAHPPLGKVCSTSSRCVWRRDSSSSTSILLANKMSSCRIRSSLASILASCNRAMSFSWKWPVRRNTGR